MGERAAAFYQKMKTLWDRIGATDAKSFPAAAEFLDALAGNGSDEQLPEPFQAAVAVLHGEFDNALLSSRKKSIENLESLLAKQQLSGEESKNELAQALWAVFFPEALYLSANPEEQVRLLRAKRVVRIAKPAHSPIVAPAREILFTSNVLLSPPAGKSLEGRVPARIERQTAEAPADEIDRIVKMASEAGKEKQLYWYDHPIPVGTALENDEAVYGLAGLARALAFEKERGNAEAGDMLKVLLSVSVTHVGLHKWALPWLRAQIGRTGVGTFKGLEVYAFTEDDTDSVVELLTPWLNDSAEAQSLKATFGVDGEYGRHYSFLKAMPALWAVLSDPELKATFKIDLDQVFPQKALAEETGKSAFEHFKTALWGAIGKDSEDRDVELGMIAGALVNEKDISSGLFTPDVPWPEGLPEGEDLLFFKQRPMAVSTRAEMMARYAKTNHRDALDGERRALQRIHVTGGTNGIRLDALRRHRPFTPSFIGRAEDQGYILSILRGRHDEALLRYAHASGLVMRHDKEAFAGPAVKAGKSGSYVGDLVRLFVFSHYADFLSGGPAEIKKQVDPFTGCFISPLPATLSLLRLALHLLDPRISLDERESSMKLAAERLPEWIQHGEDKAAQLQNLWIKERKAWDAYYDALDRLEKALVVKDASAVETAGRFKALLENCKIT